MLVLLAGLPNKLMVCEKSLSGFLLTKLKPADDGRSPLKLIHACNKLEGGLAPLESATGSLIKSNVKVVCAFLTRAGGLQG